MASMSPPPLPDDSEEKPSGIVGFSFNGICHDEIGIGESDINGDIIEEHDYDSFSGLDNDNYDVTGMAQGWNHECGYFG